MQNTAERAEPRIVVLGHPQLDDHTRRIEDIEYTPDLCRLILEKANLRNRPQSPGFARRYTNAMLAKQWRETTDLYGFYWDGALQNGQTRMQAQIDADCTLVVPTRLGLPDDSREGQDQGRRRTARDLLAMDGYPRDPTYASGLRFVLVMRRIWTGKMASFNDASNQPLMHDIRDLAGDEDFGDSHKVGDGMYRSELKMPRALASALHYLLLCETDFETATTFFERVMLGTELSPGSPILLLRRALINNRNSARKMRGEAMCAIFIRAFNAEEYNEPVEVLSYREGQKFPRFGSKPSRRHTRVAAES